VYASVGVPHCPSCGNPIKRQSSEAIVQAILGGELSKTDDRVMILAPIVRGRKGAYRKELEKLSQDGYFRVGSTASFFPLDDPPQLDKRKNHTIEVGGGPSAGEAGNRFAPGTIDRGRAEAGAGLVTVAVVVARILRSRKLACPDCGISVPQLEPRSFRFNSPYGACPGAWPRFEVRFRSRRWSQTGRARFSTADWGRDRLLQF